MCPRTGVAPALQKGVYPRAVAAQRERRTAECRSIQPCRPRRAARRQADRPRACQGWRADRAHCLAERCRCSARAPDRGASVGTALPRPQAGRSNRLKRRMCPPGWRGAGPAAECPLERCRCPAPDRRTSVDAALPQRVGRLAAPLRPPFAGAELRDCGASVPQASLVPNRVELWGPDARTALPSDGRRHRAANRMRRSPAAPRFLPLSTRAAHLSGA